MGKLMGSFGPDVLVIQCGADSLSKDRLGHLNLSIRGHAECLNHMKTFGVPMVLLGGGGYTIENVSRCWAYETGVMLGVEIDNNIPKGEYYASSYYSKDDFKIHFEVDKVENMNSREYLDNLVMTITENIRESEIRPSLAYHNAPKNYLPTVEI